jgi:hypothetical protein
MECRTRRGWGWWIGAWLVGCLGATSAAAAPYAWTTAQIQELADVTAAFHGGAGQLSTIDSITPLPGGVELDVTFRIGQEADPFAPNYGLGFARVSLQGLLGAPGLDLGAFTSSAVQVTTTTDLTVQSFLLTDFVENGTTVDDGDATPAEAFSFLFWEHNDGVGAPGPTLVDFDFAQATEFSGDWNVSNPQPVQGTDAVRGWGIQLAKFSGVEIDQPVGATIRIESVPEPSPLGLLGPAAGVLLVLARRAGR